MSTQPLGAVIDAAPDRRACTDAIRTSLASSLFGRGSVNVDPNVDDATTSCAEGDWLRAGPAPAIVTPSPTPSATKSAWRRNRTNCLNTECPWRTTARLRSRRASLDLFRNACKLTSSPFRASCTAPHVLRRERRWDKLVGAG